MDTTNSILILIFCGITAIALLTILNLLLPFKVERIRETLEDHSVHSFVIGLVALGLSFAILALLGYLINLPILQSMASENVGYLYAVHGLGRVLLTLLLLLVGLSLISISAFGLAALANSLGQRIRSTNLPINRNLTGAALLILSGLTPFLGWFIFSPVAICIGFGSMVQAFFHHDPTPKAAE
jgi:hypothetical protein